MVVSVPLIMVVSLVLPMLLFMVSVVVVVGVEVSLPVVSSGVSQLHSDNARTAMNKMPFIDAFFNLVLILLLTTLFNYLATAIFPA